MANGFTPEMEPAIEMPTLVGEAPKITREPREKWTDDRVDLLKKLWAEGLSAQNIAYRIRPFTRNAIIGKVHRLGLPGRITRAKAPRRKPRKRLQPRTNYHIRHNATEDSLPPIPVEDFTVSDPPKAERISIHDLTQHTCRWPIGTPGHEDFAYCGRKKERGPYCAGHGSLAYR